MGIQRTEIADYGTCRRLCGEGDLAGHRGFAAERSTLIHQHLAVRSPHCHFIPVGSALLNYLLASRDHVSIRSFAVNCDTLKGQWRQFAGRLRSKSGKLTDDDWTLSAVKDALVGKLQDATATRSTGLKKKSMSQRRIVSYEPPAKTGRGLAECERQTPGSRLFSRGLRVVRTVLSGEGGSLSM